MEQAGSETRVVACPTCGKAVPWCEESKWRPFCSERCRFIDLGEWFDEGYRLSDSDPNDKAE